MLKATTFCPLPLYKCTTWSTTSTYCMHTSRKPHAFVIFTIKVCDLIIFLISCCHPYLFYQCIPSSFIHLPNLSVPLSDTFCSHILPLRRALFSHSSTPFILILFPRTPIHLLALDYFENVSCPLSLLFHFSLSFLSSLPLPHLSPLHVSVSSQRWF